MGIKPHSEWGGAPRWASGPIGNINVEISISLPCPKRYLLPIHWIKITFVALFHISPNICTGSFVNLGYHLPCWSPLSCWYLKYPLLHAASMVSLTSYALTLLNKHTSLSIPLLENVSHFALLFVYLWPSDCKFPEDKENAWFTLIIPQSFAYSSSQETENKCIHNTFFLTVKVDPNEDSTNYISLILCIRN